MINIIKTKLENKTDKSFIYSLSATKIVLEPKKTITITGDIFSREFRQEGSTENLLVNIYNGNIAMTLIVDDKFVTAIERDSVVVLPKRSQEKLIKVEAPKKVETKVEAKTAAKTEPKAAVEPAAKVEPTVKAEVKVETPKKVENKAEAKPVAKVEPKKEESLENIEIKDTDKKDKKVSKL